MELILLTLFFASVREIMRFRTIQRLRIYLVLQVRWKLSKPLSNDVHDMYLASAGVIKPAFHRWLSRSPRSGSFLAYLIVLSE